MEINQGFQAFGELAKSRKIVKPPAHEWQDLALRIIAELGVPPFKRSAVFKVCKQFSKIEIERCLNDTKELCQTGQCWRYFFKVIDQIDKPIMEVKS
ncbi:MAG: hypothetical protein WCK11_05115 [Candidatus Falkowbacteria bacterium]